MLPLNVPQKLGVFFVVTGWIVLFVLHNPTDGYLTTDTGIIPPSGESAPAPKKTVREVTPEEFPQFIKEQQAWVAATSYRFGETIDIPFFDWRSEGAFLPQVSRIRSVLLFGLALLAIGCSWIWLFRTRPEVARVGEPIGPKP